MGVIKDLRMAAKAEEAAIWDAVANGLSRARKNRSEVNIYKINKFTSKDDRVIVPGKVLGSGKLNHRVDVAAFQFTLKAKEEIEGTGGSALSIQELIKKNSKGSGVKIIG